MALWVWYYILDLKSQIKKWGSMRINLKYNEEVGEWES